jgi:hypothetical protein
MDRGNGWVCEGAEESFAGGLGAGIHADTRLL